MTFGGGARPPLFAKKPINCKKKILVLAPEPPPFSNPGSAPALWAVLQVRGSATEC